MGTEAMKRERRSPNSEMCTDKTRRKGMGGASKVKDAM